MDALHYTQQVAAILDQITIFEEAVSLLGEVRYLLEFTDPELQESVHDMTERLAAKLIELSRWVFTGMFEVEM